MTEPTREDWMRRAVDQLHGLVGQVAGIAATDVRVSVSGRGRRFERYVPGVCYPRGRDGITQIYVGADVDSPDDVLETVLHLYIHAALNSVKDPLWRHHVGRYADIARGCGLVEPFRQAQADGPLSAELMAIADMLGPFPPGPARQADGRSGDMSTSAPSGGRSDMSKGSGERHVAFYCTVHPGPVRMSATKAGRCALICTELVGDTICGKPITRKGAPS